MIMYVAGNKKWVRHEALASILRVIMCDVPSTHSTAQQFDSVKASWLESFYHASVLVLVCPPHLFSNHSVSMGGSPYCESSRDLYPVASHTPCHMNWEVFVVLLLIAFQDPVHHHYETGTVLCSTLLNHALLSIQP